MSEPQQPPAQQYGTPPQGDGHRAPQSPGVQPSAQPQPAAQSHPTAQPQPAGQTQHAGQQHPAAPHAGSGVPGFAPPASSPAHTGAPLGRLALIVALAALGIGLIVTISYPVMIRTLADPSSIGVFGTIGSGLVLVVSVAALILGLMSVRRPNQQVLAGIAIGISAGQIIGIVVSWMSNLFYALSY
ncbi:hypothetical protein [Microbacterium sp. Leaf320]|uniref:hypothetical protein n=1 Tax=Microbacterium sp. Leaf320 TaxID=1736334 RepID=UPI0006FE4059|nr:hypothetical protein [Microbacterium sp. Leaf320]KQQ67300.1 hypothetical protein ASF63_08870 [Microbacterium sp. Leaf320]